MSARRYAVDWDDSSYPAIVQWQGYGEPLTLTQAKTEIVEHYQDEIKHARDQIAKARATRVADVGDDKRKSE